MNDEQSTTKFRNWIFTLNNPTCTLESLVEIAKKQGCKAFAGQLEKGSNGTPHYQFFIAYTSQRRRSQLSKDFPRCFIEKANSPLDAWDYCTKLDTREPGTNPLTFGIPPVKRTSKADVKRLNKMVLELGVDSLVESGHVHLKDYIKISQAAELYKMRNTVFEDLPTLESEWHYGPTGVGKSSSVRQRFPNPYIKGINKWWDGYKGQETVLLEDLGPEHAFLVSYLKRWGDHYSFSAEVKGGTMQIRPKRILVTS